MSHVEARPLPTDWLIYGLVTIIVGCAITRQSAQRHIESYEFAGGRVINNEIVGKTPTHLPVSYTNEQLQPGPGYLRYPESEPRPGRAVITCFSRDSLPTITRWYLARHPEAVVMHEAGGVVVLAHPRNSVRLEQQDFGVKIEVFEGRDPTLD